MSDTAKDWRMVADLLAANADRLPSPMRAREIVDECLAEADRLDREAAEERAAEGLVSTIRNVLPVSPDRARMCAPAAARAADEYLRPIAEWLIAEKEWKVTLALPTPEKSAPRQVHNHSTEDGPGLACQERRMDGLMVGACIAGPWPTVADIPVGVDRVRDHGGIEWRRDCAGWWSPDALDAGIAYAPAPFSRVEVSA